MTESVTFTNWKATKNDDANIKNKKKKQCN